MEGCQSSDGWVWVSVVASAANASVVVLLFAHTDVSMAWVLVALLLAGAFVLDGARRVLIMRRHRTQADLNGAAAAVRATEVDVVRTVAASAIGLILMAIMESVLIRVLGGIAFLASSAQVLSHFAVRRCTRQRRVSGDR